MDRFASSTLARDYRRAYFDLAEALLADAGGAASQETLKRVRATLELSRTAEMEDFFRDPCLASRSAVVAAPEALDPLAVLIHPVLFDDRSRLDERSTIDLKFRHFHAKHPDVYAAICHLARQAKRAGRDKIGVGMIFEVLRWQTFIAARDDEEPYRLNNSYRSRYARLVMDIEDDLDGIFDLRELRAA